MEVPWWCSGLRVRHCCSCGKGCNCGEGSIPGPGTSTSCECGQKKKRIRFSEWNLWKDTYNEYLLNNSKFPGVSAGSGSGIVTMAAEVAPVAWVHSLSQELPHAMGGAKKN